MLQRFVVNEKHLYLRANINYREGWKETIYKTIGQFYRSVPSLVPLSSRKFLQIESKVVDPPIEKKSPSHRAANLQVSPVNKAGEKQIDGLKTGAARPRQGRRGRTPPFFSIGVRGKSIRSPGRIRATLTFVHVESEKFPPSIVIHVSLSILTFHTSPRVSG